MAPATSTCRPEHADVVRFESYTAGGANRALRQAGCLDLLPVPCSSLPPLMRTRRYPVVTEFGAADLRGRTLDQRRRALVALAHPAHREELQRAAGR